MVEIVASHGLNQRLERHLPAFRMREGPGEIFWRKRSDERQIPLPYRCEEVQRVGQRICAIPLGPPLLIERLNDVIRFRQCLP